VYSVPIPSEATPTPTPSEDPGSETDVPEDQAESIQNQKGTLLALGWLVSSRSLLARSSLLFANRVDLSAASVGKSRAAVLRRNERRRSSSASDDEVGGFLAPKKGCRLKSMPDLYGSASTTGPAPVGVDCAGRSVRTF
jgi:hypothetical protein